MPVKLFVVIGTVFTLLILENKFPFFTFKNSFWARVGSNLGLGLFNSIASSLFTLLVANYIIARYPHQGILTIIDSPAIVGIISFLILDLYMYLWHRSMHLVPLAWQFHRIHHTDRTMNVSTAYRFHPIEIVSSSIPKLILIWWLGISTELLTIYELVFTLIVALHHSNLAIPSALDRILGWIIITPNYHRVHHSQVVTETNSNYGSVFSCWDRLFHTITDRADIIDIQLGVSDENRELNIWELIKLPIERLRNL